MKREAEIVKMPLLFIYLYTNPQKEFLKFNNKKT